MTATELLTTLEAQGAQLTNRNGRLHLAAPPDVLTPALRAAVDQHRLELPRLLAAPTDAAAPPPRPDLPIEALLGLPLSQFAQAGRPLEVRVPWAPATLWFVPTEADAEVLARQGIARGRCWTADELRTLLAIPGITKAQARQIAETKLAFEGDLAAADPTVPTDRPAKTPAATEGQPGEGTPSQGRLW
jgi:hypothetical protein